jgi:hypothetical protein
MEGDIDYERAYRLERAKRLELENDMRSVAKVVAPVIKSFSGGKKKFGVPEIASLVFDKKNKGLVDSLIGLAPIAEKYQEFAEDGH